LLSAAGAHNQERKGRGQANQEHEHAAAGSEKIASMKSHYY
jgi:hypothetical protein